MTRWRHDGPATSGGFQYDQRIHETIMRMSVESKLNIDEITAMRGFFSRHPMVLEHFAADIRNSSKSVEFLWGNLKKRMAAERRLKAT